MTPAAANNLVLVGLLAVLVGAVLYSAVSVLVDLAGLVMLGRGALSFL